MNNHTLNHDQLNEAFKELSSLSSKEYKEDLPTVIQKAGRDKDIIFSRVGRLVGIVLKEPLSEEIKRTEPSRTGAYYDHRLDLSKVKNVEEEQPWQLSVYKAFLAEDRETDNRWNNSLETMVSDLKYERSFWFYFVRSTRKYVCGNPDLKRRLEEQEAELKKQLPTGANVNLGLPAMLGLGSYSLATTLVASVPFLAAASPIVVAGIIAVIVTISVDSFCDYSDQGMFKSDKLYEADKEGN